MLTVTIECIKRVSAIIAIAIIIVSVVIVADGIMTVSTVIMLILSAAAWLAADCAPPDTSRAGGGQCSGEREFGRPLNFYQYSAERHAERLL